MAEAQTDNGGTSLDIRSGPLGIKIFGKESIVIILILALMANAGVMLWQHAVRSFEHEQITCYLRLNLFMMGVPRATPIEWDKVPVDLYTCIPRFLYERKPQ